VSARTRRIDSGGNGARDRDSDRMELAAGDSGLSAGLAAGEEPAGLVSSGEAPEGPPAVGVGQRVLQGLPGGSHLFNLTIHYGLVVLLVAVVIFFRLYGATGAVYLSHANLTALVGNQAVVAIVALAALVPLTAGYIDLSAGAITGVASITCAAAVTRFQVPVGFSLMLGIVAGLLLGTVNGVLIARFEFSSIVTTLGTSTALSGLMLWYTGGSTIGSNMPQSLLNFGSLNWLGIPRVTYVMVPVILISWFLLENTPFGRYLQATASNPRSARLVGLNVKRNVLAAFMLAGLLAGIAGVLLTARSGVADSTTGPSYLFPALAAVFLGATTIHPGRPNVWGTVIGIFFVAFIVSGLSLVGASSWAPDLFNGLILIVAAGMAIVFARRRGGGPRLF
jgi:ribose transport system permease protein